MDNKKGLLLFGSILILSISIVIASKFISDALNNVGLGLEASNPNNSNNSSYEHYELIVKDGWFYLYNTNTGQIYKKADNDNPNDKWDEVKRYTQP